MASPTELVDCISQTVGISRPACESTWKELRSKQLVINSGRGNRGTQVTARDCAVFLIALCGADHVKDSAGAVATYGDCTLERSEVPINFEPLAPLGSSHTLLTALEAIIEAYRTESIPIVHFDMVLPGGGAGRGNRTQSVALIVKSPAQKFRHPAAIGVDETVIAEYYRQPSSEEMFDGIAGTKRRMTSPGDLQIEKRITSATFNALGELLRIAA